MRRFNLRSFDPSCLEVSRIAGGDTEQKALISKRLP